MKVTSNDPRGWAQGKTRVSRIANWGVGERARLARVKKEGLGRKSGQ